MTAAHYRGEKQFSVDQIEAVAPEPGEVQIKVAYCGICGTDMHIFQGHMDARVGFERVIGHEMSGVVHALGEGVTGYEIGQKVVVRPLAHCDNCPACDEGLQHICHNLKVLGIDTHGAMQEYWAVPSDTLRTLPQTLPLTHAALIEPVAVACHDVRLSGLKPGETVVVIGGGPIGMLVAMIARDAGGEVIISEVNESRLNVAKSLGFSTLNPLKTGLAEAIDGQTDGKGADVIFEVSGTQAGVDAMTAIAAARARIVMVAIHADRPKVDLFQFFWREIKLLGARVYEPQDYDKAIEKVSSGAIDADTIITDIRPLTEVQAAFDDLAANPSAVKSLLKVGEFA
ncbi:MAG: alcohol dehydrogenase catalytic domain-containing protein [Cognatishimia sp.]